jgi:hypothetical protein
MKQIFYEHPYDLMFEEQPDDRIVDRADDVLPAIGSSMSAPFSFSVRNRYCTQSCQMKGPVPFLSGRSIGNAVLHVNPIMA